MGFTSARNNALASQSSNQTTVSYQLGVEQLKRRSSAALLVENLRQATKRDCKPPEYGIALSDIWGQWVGQTGHFSAADDADAIRQAKSLRIHDLNVEVWDSHFDRLISRLPAERAPLALRAEHFPDPSIDELLMETEPRPPTPALALSVK